MKVEGKSLFTVESINNGKPVMKKDIEKDVKLILEMMKKHQLTKVTL